MMVNDFLTANGSTSDLLDIMDVLFGDIGTKAYLINKHFVTVQFIVHSILYIEHGFDLTFRQADICETFPCQNGTCASNNDPGFACTCNPGFMGSVCDTGKYNLKQHMWELSLYNIIITDSRGNFENNDHKMTESISLKDNSRQVCALLHWRNMVWDKNTAVFFKYTFVIYSVRCNNLTVFHKFFVWRDPIFNIT